MRSWSNEGNYALMPHEDLGQCRSLKQKGFEIQTVANFQVIAVNICIENVRGGDLVYWNIQPDNNSRQHLEITETGYPYPSCLLFPFDKITLAVRVGDIYCFNGKNVHAVTPTQSTRSTLSFFGINQRLFIGLDLGSLESPLFLS